MQGRSALKNDPCLTEKSRGKKQLKSHLLGRNTRDTEVNVDTFSNHGISGGKEDRALAQDMSFT